MSDPAITKGEALVSFQDHLDDINNKDTPEYIPPHFLSIYRHPCPEQRNVSKAIDLYERYLTAEDIERSDLAPWAFIWKEGSCRKCKQTARSSKGLLVNTDKRPPISGRVARA